MNYKEQLSEIKRLTKSIEKKAKMFTKNADSIHFGDLYRIIDNLKEANDFLK